MSSASARSPASTAAKRTTAPSRAAANSSNVIAPPRSRHWLLHACGDMLVVLEVAAD
jgi:hypothetical protein